MPMEMHYRGRVIRLLLLVCLVFPGLVTFVPQLGHPSPVHRTIRRAGRGEPQGDPFQQRGGITTTDLRSRERAKPRGLRDRERRGSWNEGRSFQRNMRSEKGPRTGRSTERRVWKPEEPLNLADLTEEEREERFRAQIQSPVTLTTFIHRSKTPGEFMWTITAAMQETMLNHIHIAAAFNKLASLKKTTPLTDKIRRSPTLVQLAKQAARVADRREFRAREISSLLMSCAALRKDLPWISEELGTSLAKWVPHTSKEMNPQALSNTVYGLGVLDLGDSVEVSSALEQLSSVIPTQLGRFSSMDVAQVAWGIGARDGREDVDALLGAVAKWVTAEAPELPTTSASMDLPMVAVAFVRLQRWDAEMMEAIARRLGAYLSQMRLWSLAALVWSWNHPIAPKNAETKSFLRRLRQEATWRQITPEDLERVPEGPKGETSKSWSTEVKETPSELSVVETF